VNHNIYTFITITKMRHFASLLLPLLCLTPVQADYATDAEAAIKTLNDKWYNVDTGLW
jgi:hypothetical protein